MLGNQRPLILDHFQSVAFHCSAHVHVQPATSSSSRSNSTIVSYLVASVGHSLSGLQMKCKTCCDVPCTLSVSCMATKLPAHRLSSMGSCSIPNPGLTCPQAPGECSHPCLVLDPPASACCCACSLHGITVALPVSLCRMCEQRLFSLVSADVVSKFHLLIKLCLLLLGSSLGGDCLLPAALHCPLFSIPLRCFGGHSLAVLCKPRQGLVILGSQGLHVLLDAAQLVCRCCQSLLLLQQLTPA